MRGDMNQNQIQKCGAMHNSSDLLWCFTHVDCLNDKASQYKARQDKAGGWIYAIHHLYLGYRMPLFIEWRFIFYLDPWLLPFNLTFKGRFHRSDYRCDSAYLRAISNHMSKFWPLWLRVIITAVELIITRALRLRTWNCKRIVLLWLNSNLWISSQQKSQPQEKCCRKYPLVASKSMEL